MSDAKARGFRRVFLSTNQNNDRSQQLHVNRGLTLTERSSNSRAWTRHLIPASVIAIWQASSTAPQRRWQTRRCVFLHLGNANSARGRQSTRRWRGDISAAVIIPMPEMVGPISPQNAQ
jgi:hypothetical protein